MTTIIDGAAADIKIENEKTLGDALSGLEKWAGESGFCLSGVTVDGVRAGADDMDALFNREIRDITTLGIDTAPFAAMYADALSALSAALRSWDRAGDDRNEAESQWRGSPAAAFIARYDKPLSDLLKGRFSDEIAAEAAGIVKDREAEAENPVAAFLSMEDGLNEYVSRLSDLPLDLQTGNDRRAAETIERFSGFTQKLFRLLPFLKYAMIEKPCGNAELFDEFKSALKEFLAAYENKDMVLCGDLAEYEIAPRIKDIYATLKEKITAN
ncbi:MAG: hypothetical protein LBH50_06135 [Spirochaetaceae bacterium]|jgi:hypothetical protein|nr:hypothetical protein [Spirochaetaceae bacterium]